MELAHPEMLAWLWLLPVAAVLLWLGQRRRLRRLERASGLTVAGGGQSAWGLRPGRTLLKAALITLALAALALGLAQPRWGFQWTEVRHKGADLVIAVDVSSSMLARDVDPSRLERAKREVLDLLDTLHGDRIGLVAFAGAAFVECPLTEDYGAVRLFLNYLDPELIPLQGTDLGAAIETSLRALDAGGEGAAATGKAILLVTDGEDLEGHVAGPAQAAKQAGVRIYTAGIGSKDGAPIPDPDGGFKKDAQGNVVITRPDEAALENLALATGGMFARSTAAKPALVELYDQGISKTLALGELRTTRQKVWFDRFQWCLGLTLLLLVIEAYLRDVGVRGVAASAADGGGKRAPRGRAAALWAAVALGLLALGALARSAFAATPASSAPAGPGPSVFAAPPAAKPGAGRVEAPAKSYNEAVGRFRSGDYDAAADGFTKAAQAEDQTLAERSYYDLGNSEVGRNHLQDAVKAYESALALNPDDADAKDNLNFVKKLLEQQQEDERSRQQSQQNQQAQQNQQNQQGQGQQSQQGQQGSQGQQPQNQQNQQASQGQQSQQQGSQGQQDQQASQGQQQQNQPQAGRQQNQPDQQSQGSPGEPLQANQQAQQSPQDQQRQQGSQGQQPQDQQTSQNQQPSQGQDKQDQQRQQGQQSQGQSPQLAQNAPQGQKPQQGGGADAKDGRGGGADNQTQAVRNDGPGQGSPMTPEEAENVLRTVDDNVKKHLFAPKAKGRPQHLEKDW